MTFDQTTILVISIALLSAILLVVGIYSVLIIRDFRQTLKRINHLLDRVNTVTDRFDENVIRPTTSLAGILTVLREGAQIVGEMKQFSNETKPPPVKSVEVEPVQEEAPAVAHEIPQVVREAEARLSPQPEPIKPRSYSPHRRFFTKRSR